MLSEVSKFGEKKAQEFGRIILDDKYLEKSGWNCFTLLNAINFVFTSNKEEFAEIKSSESENDSEESERFVGHFYLNVFVGHFYLNVFEKHLGGKKNSPREVDRKFT